MKSCREDSSSRLPTGKAVFVGGSREKVERGVAGVVTWGRGGEERRERREGEEKRERMEGEEKRERRVGEEKRGKEV